MMWFIEDTNEHQITISNAVQEWVIPKFRIYMKPEGTFVHLYWTESESGAQRYLISIDYALVECAGYAYVQRCPTSAADLEAIINEMIVSGFDGGGGGGGGGTGRSVATFFDLYSTPHLESQWVEAFDENTGQGGGYFIYYNESNLAIPLIAGYQIKTSSGPTGYWRRVDPINQFNAVWCGAMNRPSPGTLASHGWTQTEADTMWGSALVDVSTDTYDLAALRYCFSLLNTYDQVTVNLEPKSFYVNDTAWIPKYYEYLRIYGNYAWILPTNTNTFDLIARPEPDDLADAQVMLNCKLYAENLNLSASDPTQTCFKPGPSTSCTLVSINTYNGLLGIHLQFCLNNYLIECENKLSISGFLIENDDCVDCTVDNSNSNMTTLVHCRCYNEDGAGEKAFAFYGVSGGAMEHCTVEGHFYANPIYIDGQNAGTIKGFNIWNCHYECVDSSTDSTNEAFIYVRLAGGVVRVVGVIGHYPMIMVNSGGTTGTVHVSIEDVVGWAPYTGNKWFYNGGGSTYDLINIPDLGGDPSIIAALILGTAMFDWWSAGPGNNRFRLLATPLNAVVPGGAGATNLSIANQTSTTLDIASSTGTDATVPAATTANAGLQAASDKLLQNIQNPSLAAYSFYECFSAPITGPVGDFYAQVANSGTVTSLPTLDLDHPGIIVFDSGTASASGTGTISTNMNRFCNGGGVIVMEAIIKIDALSTNLQRYLFRFGTNSNPMTNLNVFSGYGFHYDEGGISAGGTASANWQIYTCQGGNRTIVATGTPVAANTWYKLRAEVNAGGTSIQFFINGSSVGTHGAGQNVPTGITQGFALGAGLIKSVGTTSRTAQLDYIRYYQILTNAR